MLWTELKSLATIAPNDLDFLLYLQESMGDEECSRPDCPCQIDVVPVVRWRHLPQTVHSGQSVSHQIVVKDPTFN